ncbi:MAG: zf-HC2 domain-containing protein [Candidatus Eisenbacteria bacterium]
MDHEKIDELISSYLDNELDEDQRRLVEEHIEKCPECRREYGEMTRFEEVMRKMTLKQPPREAWQVYSESVYNRAERGIGWILLSIGAMIILFFSGYQIVKGFIQDPTIPVIVKAGILLGMGGVVILLVSVVRERVFVGKHERYKEIQK